MNAGMHLRRLLPLLCGLALTGCGSDPASPASVHDAGSDAAVVSDGGGTTDASSDVAGDVSGDVPSDAATPTPTPITVTTRLGPVTGRTDGTIASFLGIPYVAAPVGPLRWRNPADHAPWTTPIDASHYGSVCPQAAGTLLGMPPMDEDCLTLNVWTPHPATGAGAGLPVMVFIHGGGFTSGASAQGLYDGRALASHNVVVVTLNYRLGQLGFLAHPALVAEDTTHHSAGNYGVLDQQAALRWVQANAAAFGGDPSRVTLFGESAGAISVCAQMASPLASGLFQRAIGESGPCTFIVTPLHDGPAGTPDSAESLGHRFASALHCDTAATPAMCMRAVPWADVLAAVPTPIELSRTGARYQPNIDGWVLPEAPWQSFRHGRVAHVDSLSGTNRDEGTFFTVGSALTSESAYQAAVEALVPGHGADILRLYPVSAYPSVTAAYDAFLTDAVFTCPTRDQARYVTALATHVYLYHFTRLNHAGMLLGLGVFHSSELPYVFGDFVPPFTADDTDTALSNTMMNYWTRFAATGDPNGGADPMWPAFTTAGDSDQGLGDTVAPETGLHRANCDALEP